MASESKVARVSPPDAISPVAAVEAPAAAIQPSKGGTSGGAARGPTPPPTPARGAPDRARGSRRFPRWSLGSLLARDAGRGRGSGGGRRGAAPRVALPGDRPAHGGGYRLGRRG